MSDNKRYLVLLKKRLEELQTIEITRDNLYLTDVFNRLTIVVLIVSLLSNVNKEPEKSIQKIKQYMNTDSIKNNIDVKFWLSKIEKQ